MATIHIGEIQRLLAERGNPDAQPNPSDGMFLEISFEKPSYTPTTVDEEYARKSLVFDCPYGTVNLTFDDAGQLKTLDLS